MAAAAGPLDCQSTTVVVGAFRFDLRALSTDVTTPPLDVETPPTRMRVDTYVNVCAPLSRPTELPAVDFCDDGAFVCEVGTNIKKNEADRVIYVKPWALKPSGALAVSAAVDGKSISIFFEGGSWASSSTLST
ncbi:hypothetical protein HK405_013305, partial [Cladochytrium tenue]